MNLPTKLQVAMVDATRRMIARDKENLDRFVNMMAWNADKTLVVRWKPYELKG